MDESISMIMLNSKPEGNNQKPKVVAIVHAKGSSERVPNKNQRMLGDRPLFCHAINIAMMCRDIDEVVIDSENDQILRVGQTHGAIPLKRPTELATNLATGDNLALWQASNYPDSEIILQVIPTAPFLKPETLSRAIEMVRELGVDSVVAVCKDVFYHWTSAGKPAYYRENGTIPNSADMNPVIYETTGLYVNKTAAVLRTKKRLNPQACRPLFVSKLEAIDINTSEDFNFAEIVWRGLNYQIKTGHEV